MSPEVQSMVSPANRDPLCPSRRRGNSIPITTRQLESLVRLAQARARAELRDRVTEADAKDVVLLMEESLLEAFTNETGQVSVCA